jgi:hypothetical protein
VVVLDVVGRKPWTVWLEVSPFSSQHIFLPIATASLQQGISQRPGQEPDELGPVSRLRRVIPNGDDAVPFEEHSGGQRVRRLSQRGRDATRQLGAARDPEVDQGTRAGRSPHP